MMKITLYNLTVCSGVMISLSENAANKNLLGFFTFSEIMFWLYSSYLFFQSLKSRGYVKEQFAWRHYYWYLTNEGIQYLRDFLHLPPEIVPSTLKRQARAETSRPRGRDMPSRPQGGADRDAYRRGAPGSDKKADSGAGATAPENIQFVSDIFDLTTSADCCLLYMLM